MFEHPLDDPAAVRVSGKFVDIALESVNDEANVLRGDSLDSLLNDVVTILVPDAFHDMLI